MLVLKVKDGMLPDKRLCDSCKYAHIMKDDKGSERIICSTNPEHPIQITSKIVACNEYMNRTAKSLWEMKETAWALQIKEKQILGFRPPEKRDD